jgi:hypothetical protein
MTTAILETKQDFDVEDVEYLRHGDKPLLARVHKPRGEGPFPALVECHGGAWCFRTGKRKTAPRAGLVGIVSIALDFRSATRRRIRRRCRHQLCGWAKLNARALKTRPDLVGSGPVEGIWRCSPPCVHTTRHTALPLPAGSPGGCRSVRCVVMSAGDQFFSRYRHAKRAMASGVRPNGRSP